jgi:hypothetical protein
MVTRSQSTGIDLLKQFANVDTSYNMTPEQLEAKISLADALIVRSATKVGHWKLETLCSTFTWSRVIRAAVARNQSKRLDVAAWRCVVFC